MGGGSEGVKARDADTKNPPDGAGGRKGAMLTAAETRGGTRASN